MLKVLDMKLIDNTFRKARRQISKETTYLSPSFMSIYV